VDAFDNLKFKLLFVKNQVKYLKMEKKVARWVIGLLLSVGLVLGAQTTVLAAAYPQSSFLPSPATQVVDITQYGTGLVNIVFFLSFVAAFAFLLYGAVAWITSNGESGKLETARNRMIQAVVGMLVLGSTWAIYTFFLAVSGMNLNALPTL
jgi:hypothetical protein